VSSSTATGSEQQPEPPSRSLLIGSSIIRDIDQTKLVDTAVISVSGATVCDIKNRCLSIKDKFKDVTLVVGSNDCAKSEAVDEILDDCKHLLQAASDRSAGSVTVSSICPRTDKPEAYERSLTLNAGLVVLCAETNNT
jgi:hypothetical protein